ncbi:hypothetical protein MLD38_031154 [Melastoma candidum]|uniref:Uncharacterized protein n=1 Tax=Melastoma candidum TaxID=119954 RepID=A0ACB9MQE9_9MYRT|nr:hypothetical protein MLD38_031154 [Melastoma candidum]
MASDDSSKVEVVTVDVIHAKDLVASSGHRYLDVRTEAEFNTAHPDAGEVLNIPYMFITPEGRVKNPQFLEQVSSAYRPDDKIVVGCRSGVRSLAAAGDLLNAGYKHVYNVGGGHLAWVEKGLPVKQLP